MSTLPPQIRMTDRENYLIESGKALYNEQNAQVAKYVEDFEIDLISARARADKAIGEVKKHQDEARIVLFQRDALIEYLNAKHREECRAKKKGPTDHPDVEMLLSAARAKAVSHGS